LAMEGREAEGRGAVLVLISLALCFNKMACQTLKDPKSVDGKRRHNQHSPEDAEPPYYMLITRPNFLCEQQGMTSPLLLCLSGSHALWFTEEVRSGDEHVSLGAPASSGECWLCLLCHPLFWILHVWQPYLLKHKPTRFNTAAPSPSALPPASIANVLCPKSGV